MGVAITHCLYLSFLLRGRTPHTPPLLQFGAPPMGDSPPLISPVLVLPTGCSASGTGCSSVDPPRGHKPCQQTCSIMDSAIHRSTGPARSLLQRGLSTGSQPPLGIHLLQYGFFHRVQVDICSTVDLYGLQGDNLPHHGLLHKLQENFCSGSWSTPSPSVFTDLGVCRAVALTYFHSLQLKLPLPSVFFPPS